MKAVVLVGGEGTRLRPITETLPKPLIPLLDRPSLDHVLDHLAGHGVHEVVLSSSYLKGTFHTFIQARGGDPSITWITETEPLGTGGAIVNALGALGMHDPFFAVNGDILTDLDLTEMLARHRDRGAVATIALTHVEDARPYGLVPLDADGRVLEFREKPSELVPGDINAGTYVLDPVALEGWTPGGVPFRGVLDGSRDAAGVPAGAVRPARRPGGRPPLVPVAVRRRRRPDRPRRDSERACRRRASRQDRDGGAGERHRPARACGGRTRHDRGALDPRPRLEGDAGWFGPRFRAGRGGRGGRRRLGARGSGPTRGTGR